MHPDNQNPQNEASASSERLREQWNQRYSAKELIWTAKANRFVMEQTADLAPGLALDFGAGECRNAVWLAEQGWQVQAIDISDVAMDKGQQLASKRGVADKIHFQAADVGDYQPEADHFDLVMLIYLQMPMAKLAPIVARAARALKVGGTFLLVAHDSSNIQHGYGGPQNPDMLYSSEQVLDALGERLQIEESGVVERPVTTEDGTKIALDCLVRARRTA